MISVSKMSPIAAGTSVEEYGVKGAGAYNTIGSHTKIRTSQSMVDGVPK